MFPSTRQLAPVVAPLDISWGDPHRFESCSDRCEGHLPERLRGEIRNAFILPFRVEVTSTSPRDTSQVSAEPAAVWHWHHAKSNKDAPSSESFCFVLCQPKGDASSDPRDRRYIRTPQAQCLQAAHCAGIKLVLSKLRSSETSHRSRRSAVVAHSRRGRLLVSRSSLSREARWSLADGFFAAIAAALRMPAAVRSDGMRRSAVRCTKDRQYNTTKG